MARESLALLPEFDFFESSEFGEPKSSHDPRAWADAALTLERVSGGPIRDLSKVELARKLDQTIKRLDRALADVPEVHHARIRKLRAQLNKAVGSRFRSVPAQQVRDAIRAARISTGQLASEYQQAAEIARARQDFYDIARRREALRSDWQYLRAFPGMLDELDKMRDILSERQVLVLDWAQSPRFYDYMDMGDTVTDPARGIFGARLKLQELGDDLPRFEDLRRAHDTGLRTSKKGRDQMAQNLGFAGGFSELAAQLQDAADREGRYRVTLGTDSIWTTRAGAEKALSSALGPGESLRFPREQLRAILVMSPAEFRDYQKAMRGKYTNPVAPRAARAAARSALKRRRGRARETERPGGTAVGVARARDIANGRNLSPRTLARMRSFFARHDTPAERAARARDPMSPAAIAWDLWGGDPARAWIERNIRGHRRRS